MQKAVFFDRDGVINVDTGYVHLISEFKFNDGIMETMKALLDHNYRLFIITNQSGIHRGLFSLDAYNALTDYMLKTFLENGITITHVYMCPHRPDENCSCRKPHPTLILEAQQEYDLDLKHSWMIGDKESDIICGHNAGIPNLILIKGKYPTADIHCHQISSVHEISSLILG